MGMSLSNCKALCNKDNKCGSASYREHDNTCVIADDAVKYDPKFQWYFKHPGGIPAPTELGEDKGTPKGTLKFPHHLIVPSKKDAKGALPMKQAMKKVKALEARLKK